MTKVKDSKGGRPKLADYQKRTKLVRIKIGRAHV